MSDLRGLADELRRLAQTYYPNPAAHWLTAADVLDAVAPLFDIIPADMEPARFISELIDRKWVVEFLADLAEGME